MMNIIVQKYLEGIWLGKTDKLKNVFIYLLILLCQFIWLPTPHVAQGDYQNQQQTSNKPKM